MTAERRRALWLGSLLAAIASFVVAWGVGQKRLFLLDAFEAAAFLDGNVVSGVSPEAAYQVIARAQLVGLGVGALFTGWTLVGLRRLPWLVRRPEILIVALLVPISILMLDVRSARVDGSFFITLDDDAMISLRYANNFAHGLGLVYNAGERVEGYTNFLWVALMAIPLRLGASVPTTAIGVMLTNFVLVGASASLMLASLRRMRCATWASFVAVLAFLFDCNTIWFAASGLETALLTFLVVASVWACLGDRPRLTFALLGILPLVRSDGLLIGVVLATMASWHFRKRAKSLAALPLVLVFAAAHVLFRRAYYGEWYPNTYFLKMLELNDRLLVGAGGYAFRLVWLYGVWILLALGASSLARWRVLALGSLAAFFAQASYSIFVGGDTFVFVRFVAPTLPLVYMGAARALGSLRPAATRPTMMTVALAALALCVTPVQTAYGRLGQQHRTSQWVVASFVTAEWLTRNVKAGSSVTIYPAGTIPSLASSLRFIDVLGKNDRHIGHLPHYESRVIGHNRFDFDYVYDVLKPDLALVDRGCVDFEAPRYMTEAERAALRAHDPTKSPAWDYDRTNPTFMALYSTNTVHFVGEQPPILGCIFVREGAQVSQFWSREGAVPRARNFRYAFGASNDDKRVALAGRWQITLGSAGVPGVGTSRGDGEGEGLVDAWLDLTSDLVVDVCSRDSTSLPDALRVNTRVQTEVTGERADCAGHLSRWRIPKAVLEERLSATRLRFAAGHSLYWIEGTSAP